MQIPIHKLEDFGGRGLGGRGLLFMYCILPLEKEFETVRAGSSNLSVPCRSQKSLVSYEFGKLHIRCI